MKTKISVFTLLTLFVQLQLCIGQSTLKETISEQNHFNGTLLLQHLKTLSADDFEGRRTGTKGAEKARQYIVHQFQKQNVSPLSKAFEQKFSFKRKDKMYQAVNVLGLIKGTDFPNKYLVISAHYDHEGIKNGQIYNGADDDASGVSALFSFAEYFKKNPPKHSIILAAFDAEELGLKGSNYFVKHPIVPLKSIVMNINLDMIGRSDKNELYAVGTRYNEILKQVIINFKQSEKVSLLMGHDGKDGKQDWTFSSDHGPFHKKGIPFIYFGVEDHKDYHQPTDDYENIHPQFYKETVHVIISVFKDLDSLSEFKKSPKKS